MNNQFIGVILLLVVVVMIFAILQEGTKVTASQIVKNVREFDLGEKITIYETPNLLSVEQIQAMERYALLEFFQDDLPDQYKSIAQTQNQAISGQRNLIEEQNNTTQQTGNLTDLAIQSEQADQSTVITNVKVSELTASKTEARLIESQAIENTYIRGSIVKIAGKIEMARSPPYFLNVNITCCGMDSFRAMSAFETDAQGNFLIKFATNTKFPLGDWRVTISTIGDDNKIINHFYEFKLLAPPE